jgi:hypothetical protein
MIMLDQLVERLAGSLGEGTDKLALRTGMHSGEVTAGVLRGEKGRFQLFGGEFTFFVFKVLCPFFLSMSNPPVARCASHV